MRPGALDDQWFRIPRQQSAADRRNRAEHIHVDHLKKAVNDLRTQSLDSLGRAKKAIAQFAQTGEFLRFHGVVGVGVAPERDNAAEFEGENK